MKITALKAREILDSRGIPTIMTEIELDHTSQATGAVPSGASTGSTEVLELRDGDPNRYFGKGTLKAVEVVNGKIHDAIVGKDFNTQYELDHFLIDLDGSSLKEVLGGNSILSVSMAYARAHARARRIPLYDYFGELYWGQGYSHMNLRLPQPMILIMEGGRHGNWSTDIQEYMIVPRKEVFPTVKEAIRVGAEVFKATHDLLVKKGYSGAVGFEGAFAPIRINSNAEALDLIIQGVEIAGYKPEKEILLAMDVAASEFFDKNTQKYNLRREESQLSADEWMHTLGEWMEKYPIWSIEDPLHEEDWKNWSKFTQIHGERIQIVGDDLLTTNTERIVRGIEEKSINSVLIKLNQIGTVIETLNAIRMTTEVGYSAIVSHRGGETNDHTIADLVVGTDANQSKFGGPDRGERVAKYNRLMEIEESLTS